MGTIITIGVVMLLYLIGFCFAYYAISYYSISKLDIKFTHEQESFITFLSLGSWFCFIAILLMMLIDYIFDKIDKDN